MYSTNKLFTFLTSFILLWCSIAIQEAHAQCQAQITSITPTGTACPNDPLNFIGTGQGIATSFNFNGSTFPTGWVASAFTLGQPCANPAPDGTNYFWSAAGASNVPRFVQTNAIDASAGGSLIFEIDFGNDDPQPGCEEVDANEGVFLQYSINGGTSWLDIQYFDPTDVSGGAIGYEWVLQNIPIPAAAQTVSTMFRWTQPNHSGTGYDNWGLDNISVNQTVPVIAHSWDFGDGSPLDTSGGTVSHAYTATGVYTVTYTATVVGGCTNSTTTTVTVSNPTITVADVTIPTTSGCAADLSSSNLGTPTTTSACTIVTSTNDAPDPLPIGSTVVTWTSTFSNGYTTTATHTVTVVDAQPPVVTVPSDVTVSADAGECTFTNLLSFIPNGTAADNCTGTLTYSYALSGATIGITTTLLNQVFNVGVTTVTLTVTDASGNASSNAFTVTVNDTQPPVITVPTDITVNTDANTCGAIVNYSVSASDNCSSNSSSSLEDVLSNFNSNFATTTALIPSPYSFSGGVTGNNIADGGNDMYDGGNRLNTNLATLIPYSDNTIVNSASFGTSGRYFTRKVPNMFIMAADLDGVTTFSTTGDNGADGGGSAFSSDFVVTSNGNQYRVFYKRVCGAGGDPSINQLMIIPNDASVTQTISTNTNNGLQSITNISGVNRIYYILFATTSGSCQSVATVTNIAQSFLDANILVVSSLVLNQTAGLASGSTFPVGTTTNTFTTTDASGNTATESFTVTVNDTQLPTLTAQVDFTRNADAGVCNFTNTDIPNGTATDNCSVASYSYVLTGATTGTVATLTNQVFNVGVTTVTWTATDNSGNISLTDIFTVTVNDTELPILTAQADFTRNADAGVCSFTNTDIPNGTAADNCAVASYSYVLTGATTGTVATLVNQVFNVGVTTVTWTATDASGNISLTDIFTVTVNDTQLPTLTAQADFTRNADAGVCSFTNTDIPNGTAADNCSVASYSYVLTGATTGTVATLTNQVFNVGVTTVTWTATDASGNVSLNDVFTVTVNDTELPILTARVDFTRNADAGVCNFTNTDIPNGTATDNCSVASYSYVLTGATTGTVTTLVNQVFNVGVTTITWTATDLSGNTSTNDVFTVTVNDTELPTLTAQADFTRNTGAGTCTFINTDIPNGTAADNCAVASYEYVLTGATTGTVTTLTNQVFNAGVTTVTWTATDASGNISTNDEFTVTVNATRELDILGNSVSIADGHISPNTADDTDFGSVNPERTITYTLSNTGAEAITITSITSNNAEFVVSNEPATVAAGTTETFDVTFTPTTNAIQTAIITVNNNDCDEAVYDFVVQGRRVIPNPLPAPPVPRGLLAIAVSTTQINLTWDYINQNLTEYQLYRNNVFIALLPPSAVRYEDTGLDPDTFYTYRLVAVNRRPGEIRTSEVSTNERTFPEAPILLSQTDVCGRGNSIVKVTSTGVLYRVYADSVGGSILFESSSAAINLPTVSETTTFYISVFSNDKESERTAVTINVEPVFEAKIIGATSQFSCSTILVLEAEFVEGATYRWFVNGVSTGSAGQSITVSSSGIYQVRVRKGSCSIFSDEVNVKLNYEPIAKIQQLNGVRFCDAGTLSAKQTNSTATYEWLVNNSVVGQGTSISVSESGTYTLQVTQNGCQNTDQIEVIVAPTPQTPILEATQTTICPNTETIISVQNPEDGVTYLWFRNGRNLRRTGSSLSTSIQGTYQVRALSTSNFGCYALSEEVRINHLEVTLIYLRVSEDKTTLFLEDIAGSQDEIVSVEWYFEGEAKASLGTGNQITPTENGYYLALVTNQNGCIIQTRGVDFIVPQVVVTGEEEQKNGLFNIYPNPSTGKFNVQFPVALTENIHVSIFDATGKVIQTQVFEKNNQKFIIDIEKFARGMYLIRFNQNGSTYSKSIILE